MKHHLKIIFGNLKKTAFTSFLNLIGLTSAFAAFILIMLYVWNEYHFDSFQENAAEIYRLEAQSPKVGGKTNVFLLGPTGQTLVDEFSDIINTTTYMPWGKWGEQPFSYENSLGVQRSYEDYAYTDEKLTEIFNFKFLNGSINPLGKPETAIISKSFAKKAWGDNDPMGKLLKVFNNTYTVTGVFEDLPVNSVFRCPIILKIPTQGFLAEARKDWDVTNYPQFIQVKPGTDVKELNRKINEQSIIKSKYRFFDNGKTSVTIVARPLKDLRFAKDVAENVLFETNNKMFVDSLLGVGILILMVALINYINFATANLPMRMKSFNINRIIGSRKWDSAFQILTETIIVFTVSFGLAVLLAYLLNNLFSVKVLGYELPFIQNIHILTGSAIAGLISALIAAVYPAIVSTTGKPVQMLKQTNGGMNGSIRGMLTVFQFAATIALIVASVAVVKQLRFMEQTDLGFNKSNTIVIPMYDGISNNFDTFRNELEANPGINRIARSRAVPGRAQEYNIFNVEGQSCFAWNWAVDEEYMEMMGFEIIEGRGFLKNSEAENDNYISNETAFKRYNWRIGTKIGNGQLVGVMKDFNMVSLREEIDPFVFRKAASNNNFGTVSIKFDGKNTKETLQTIKSVFEELCPEIPFRGFFLDDQLNLLYFKENQQARLITFFSLLSVIVSILGILGLSIFICQQKIKEIGIRKVNGARISEVIFMLNSDFIKWVLIAFVIAAPVAWYIMQNWLSNFAFRTTLSWWIFALAGFLALGVALLTVSWQSWRAATRNPVEALRYE
ncbi:MAG: ABC transporter permease [Prolixibacteraceae bacterium]|nr:ABC transporter permease [Prolixibacteraceae bacterium]